MKNKKILLDGGLTLEASESQFTVLLKDLTFEQKSLAKLKENDILVLRQPEGNKKKDIRLDYSQVTGKAPQKITVNNVSLEDWYYFFGIFLGDGNFIQDKGVAITSIDEEIISFFKGFVKRLGLNFSIRGYPYTKAVSVKCYSVALVKFLQKLGFDISKKSFEKKIPKKIIKNCNNLICELLRGLFDTDGSATFSKRVRGHRMSVSFCSTSLNLINQVQELLFNLKILSRRKQEKTGLVLFPDGKKYNCKPAWSLGIFNKKDLKSFSILINFKIKRKRDKVKLISESRSKMNEICDVIPYVGGFLKKYYNKESFRYFDQDKNRYNQLYFRKRTSRALIKRIINSQKVDLEIEKRLKNISNDDLLYMKVLKCG